MNRPQINAFDFENSCSLALDKIIEKQLLRKFHQANI